MSGYAKVASLMAHHGEVATFQRFEFLNMLDLLYHQAELVHLEDELRASMKIDSDSGDAIPVGESRSTQTVNMERASVMSALERRKSTPEIEHKMSGEERELQMLDEKQGKRDDEMSEQSSSFSGSSGASERFEGTRDWWYLSHASHSHTWELMLKTRKKLKEYSSSSGIPTPIS